MSYFYGYLTGNRGPTTRTGSRKSGIRAHLRSWNNDVYASLVDSEGDLLVIDCKKDLFIKINGIIYEYNQEGKLVEALNHA